MGKGVQRRIPGHGKYLMMFGVQSPIGGATGQEEFLMRQIQGTNLDFYRLKICRLQNHAGSSPASATMTCFYEAQYSI